MLTPGPTAASRCAISTAGVAEFAADLAVSWPAAAGRDIAVVAHGGTLRMLSARLTGTPVEEMRWEPLGNGCILRFPAARLTGRCGPPG